MAAPTVLNVFPANAATGIPVSAQIEVTFDQEMDEASINTGTFIVSGPDTTPTFGPADTTPLDEPGLDDEDILSSPYVGGYVKGTISFLRVDAYGNEVDTLDTTGDGTLFYTKAIFTPEMPFKQNVSYTVLLSADEDETDDYKPGCRSRSIFDPVDVVKNGTASVSFEGAYEADSTETYFVEITTGGITGTAEYIWWKASDAVTVYQGLTTTGLRELEEGIIITCSHDGSFSAGDKFSIVVKPSLSIESTYRWVFNTGAGSIVLPPSDYSSSSIEIIETEEEFVVDRMSPANAASNLTVDTDGITITFNKEIDETTITETTVLVWAESVNGDSAYLTTSPLECDLEVDGNILTITLDADQLYENNIVFITLDSTVATTDGTTLGEDITYYFTTTYEPFFSHSRRIRLDLGPLIKDVSDDTINFAIFEASLMAQALTFVLSGTNGEYFAFARREFTTCLAELTLTNALMGDSSISNRMSKHLGDLQVSRGGLWNELDRKATDFQDCVAKWQVVIQNYGDIGPDTSHRPTFAQKGIAAPDDISVGRRWEPTSRCGEFAVPAANKSVSYTERRRLRTYRRRGE